MARVDEFLALIDDPAHPPLEPGHPADGALLSLLVHLAFSDGVVQGDEFALLQRVRPELDPGALMRWANEIAAQDLDLDAVVVTATDEATRWNTLRFAARMVALDGDLAEQEISTLQDIAERLRLPPHAGRDAVSEIVAGGGPVDEEQVRDSLRHMFWDVLIPSREALESDLAGVVPQGVEHVCSIALDDNEVAGLFVDGLAGQFDHGPAFVRWEEITRYTRVPVPGAAFHLRTRDARDLSMSDARLRDIGALLDFIYGRKPVPR